MTGLLPTPPPLPPPSLHDTFLLGSGWLCRQGKWDVNNGMVPLDCTAPPALARRRLVFADTRASARSVFFMPLHAAWAGQAPWRDACRPSLTPPYQQTSFNNAWTWTWGRQVGRRSGHLARFPPPAPPGRAEGQPSFSVGQARPSITYLPPLPPGPQLPPYHFMRVIPPMMHRHHMFRHSPAFPFSAPLPATPPPPPPHNLLFV